MMQIEYRNGITFYSIQFIVNVRPIFIDMKKFSVDY